jgi:hypothetical protein
MCRQARQHTKCKHGYLIQIPRTDQILVVWIQNPYYR